MSQVTTVQLEYEIDPALQEYPELLAAAKEGERYFRDVIAGFLDDLDGSLHATISLQTPYDKPLTIAIRFMYQDDREVSRGEVLSIPTHKFVDKIYRADFLLQALLAVMRNRTEQSLNKLSKLAQREEE